MHVDQYLNVLKHFHNVGIHKTQTRRFQQFLGRLKELGMRSYYTVSVLAESSAVFLECQEHSIFFSIE